MGRSVFHTWRVGDPGVAAKECENERMLYPRNELILPAMFFPQHTSRQDVYPYQDCAMKHGKFGNKMNLDVLFRQILKPALGCTEPVAIALATAAAYQASGGWTPNESALSLHDPDVRKIRSLRVIVSRSIFKNAFAISIPNAEGHKGLPMSAALGLFCDPRKGLRLFEDLTPTHIQAAELLVAEKRVTVEVAEGVPEVYIRGEVAFEDEGCAVIQGEHSNIACLWRSGVVVHGSAENNSAKNANILMSELKALSFSELITLVDELPASVIELLRNAVKMNEDACRAGLNRPMGIGTGFFGAGDGAVSVIHQLSSLTAAGSDARMSGYPVEIMTSAGSGNQGIMATIPIVIYAKARLIEEEKMLKGLALSHLVTMYLTCYLGYLSALCGVAIKAGIGAACGLTYLMGGGTDDIERAVKIMAATLTGMICDGAKAGCALKVSSAADMALRAATLAIRQAEVPDDNGIVAATADETISNLAKLTQSMGALDENIIEIMLSKIGSGGRLPA